MESLDHACLRVIHGETRNFSLASVRDKLLTSGRVATSKRVSRILSILKKMKLLARYPKAYQYRYWQITRRMPADIELLITMYDAWVVIHREELD